MSVSVIGTYHSKVGNLEDKNLYDLIIEAGKGAINNSKVEAKEIGGVWIGNYSGGGFNNQEHTASIAIDIDPNLRFAPCNRAENACASGSAAITGAVNAIKAGEVEYALVIGVEKMTSLETKGVTKVLAKASHWLEEGVNGMTFPGMFAEYAKGYMKQYGIKLEELRPYLAKVAAKNHTNAKFNPLAQMPLEISYQDILDKPDEKNPVIADPLRVFDCSLISDGAAAIILTSTENAKKLEDDVVELSSLVQMNDYLALNKRSVYEFTAGKKVIKKVYEEAGITIDDIDFAEVHDCFTIAEILAYETIGLSEPGEGWKMLDQPTVYKDGSKPINVSGGLKAKGHPVGATGVSMAVLNVRQLQNNAIGYQVKDPEIGLAFNIGGSAASNYALVFKRIK
ncbi:thiolase domain-containing protein [Natranaerofaba carboxydovora]|uniref:thiolase domain-containing protein n=1 Tax=Natranaerofaba carboxydovora TaxID=2742683 RepID=UPI001F13CF57|nr:thiolase domain-containing protein [Natranaerofaba carboxydovora]UMZ73563.1 Beta-ketoadipyl-CoA thiolase [Natranaerofaba carboxydovora]